MTKTQALQRLYKALTGNEGRNTGSKVIEDLAIAAENGEIGGGGVEMATVTFAGGDGVSPTDIFLTGCFLNSDGFLEGFGNKMIAEVGINIFVPVIGNGTLMEVGTDYTVSVSGEATSLGNYHYLINGDCAFEITDDGGGE